MLKDIKDKIIVYKNIKEIFLDIRIILAFFGISGAGVINYIMDDALSFFYSNAPIISFCLFIAIAIYVEITRQTLNNKIITLEVNQRKRDLKARVDSMYKEYGKNTITDEWVIKSLYDMRDDLTDLKVNSYTQGKLEKMIENIEL